MIDNMEHIDWETPLMIDFDERPEQLNVVFFGDNVPLARVTDVFDALNESSALMVIGSSLMVFSGFRFAREARRQGKPLLVLTQGKTRADDIATCKIDAEIVSTLAWVVGAMG